MRCYLDSSVILRKVFHEVSPLKEWRDIQVGFASRLLRVECLRTIDRLHHVGKISDQEVARYLSDLHRLFTHMGWLPVTEEVLNRAEQPFATPVGSLDGIHLATALLWREKHRDEVLFATHDQQLGIAAQAHGCRVIGLSVA